MQSSVDIHYPSLSLGGTSEIQQPEIEFLATDKFVISQTGSRILNGLQVSWKGPSGTFRSGKKNSDLFGEAVQPAREGSLYIDVSDDSLSFTGRNTKVSAFTMGAYFWGPAANHITWFIMVPHQAEFSSNLYLYRHWCLAMYLHAIYAFEASLTYFSARAGLNWDNFVFPIPIELQRGWIHLAHAYNPNESGGTLRSYLNGNLALTRSMLNLRVRGSQGAYANTYLLTFRKTFHRKGNYDFIRIGY